ncbi:MAG: hypothetical protein N2559_05860 [Anaerolineae bacterium]|nr:hypothetical protein [Anaerolineae bacterium]
MSILNTLKSFFTSPSNSNALMLYVKCKRCGTPLAVRVNLANDLNADYDSGGYVLYKEMMDSKCFTLMRAEIRFDAARRIVEQKIDKGEFITREEYEAMVDEGRKTKDE